MIQAGTDFATVTMYTFDTNTASSTKKEVVYAANAWDESMAHVSRISWGAKSDWFVMEWINRDTTKESFQILTVPLTNQNGAFQSIRTIDNMKAY